MMLLIMWDDMVPFIYKQLQVMFLGWVMFFLFLVWRRIFFQYHVWYIFIVRLIFMLIRSSLEYEPMLWKKEFMLEFFTTCRYIQRSMVLWCMTTPSCVSYCIWVLVICIMYHSLSCRTSVGISLLQDKGGCFQRMYSL